tara:strand:- start:189 stop:542 length:354 start_codon:yes stop_codon:yes gene_type:complete
MKKIIGLFLLLTVVACATAPEKLSTQYVPASTYSNLDCEQIAAALRQKNGKLENLYSNLKSESQADAWQMGVGLVLFWPTLLFLEGSDSPEAAQYSRLKGEVEALNEMAITKKCGFN